MTGYEDAVKELTSKGKFHISLGLERISAVLALLGDPQDSLRCVHVAGTNGKGSVCAVLASVLAASGLRVGLYTSPHLVSYRERIKIDGLDISEDDFARIVLKTIEVADAAGVHLTEFEVLTAAAFSYFKENEVDIVVLETGLGGRLDATNVIKQNICSVITSISIDHTERLGGTIEEISNEKAGIIKEAPVVISPKNAGFGVVRAHAGQVLETESRVEIRFEEGVNYAIVGGKHYEFRLLGLWQKDNLELVLGAVDCLRAQGVDISEKSIETGLERVKWPCRMELRGDGVLVDGAHNFDGARRLREGLDYYFPDMRRKFVYGSLRNKDYTSILNEIVRSGDELYFFEFGYPGALEFDELGWAGAEQITERGIRELLVNRQNGELVVVCGSFYMIGDLLSKKII